MLAGQGDTEIDMAFHKLLLISRKEKTTEAAMVCRLLYIKTEPDARQHASINYLTLHINIKEHSYLIRNYNLWT